MNLRNRIGDEIHHARRVHRNHTRIIETQARFDDPATRTVDRAVFATQIGGMLESQAEHLAASWLARATTALPSSAELREEAAEWFRRSDELYVEAGRR
jgi:hypothetical protein